MARDFYYALRVLRRNPGYAAAAMLCLALGIGVNSTAFSMMDELFLRRLPVPSPDRVVRIERSTQDAACSYGEFEEMRVRIASALAGLAAVDEAPTGLDSGGINQIIVAEAVSANFAETLWLHPQIGRWFVPADEAPAAERVAVLSDHAWTERFGRDPAALGKLVRIETRWYRVVGVAPAAFRGTAPPVAAEVWVPMRAMYRDLLSTVDGRKRRRVRLIARLAEGVTTARAQAVVEAIDGELRPGRVEPLVVSVAEGAAFPGARRVAGPLTALLGAVSAIVLLIACVNVANLLLSRAAVRRREVALRRALGAARWRLARQTMAESLVLASGGAGIGVVFGYCTNRLLLRYLTMIPETHSLSAVTLEVSWRVMAFAAAAALLSAVLFTLSAVLEQSRGDVMPAIKGEAAPRSGRRQRDVYVVAQVGLSLVLLVAAGLLVRALQHAEHIAPGYSMDHRLSARIYISEPEYNADTARDFFARVLETVRAMPGVRGAALSYSVPMGFPVDTGGCAAASRGATPQRMGGGNVISPGYFDTLGIPLVAGRDFRDDDRMSSPEPVVINQTLAERFWPRGGAVGQRVWLGCDPARASERMVIGVTGDSKQIALDEPAAGYAYGLHSPAPEEIMGFMALTVHTSGTPAAFAAPLRTVLRRLDPDLRIYEMNTLREYAALSLWKVRWQAGLIGGFGGLAIVLAAIGMYGVVAYAVAQRTREIGIRMAIGARKADVLWMVLGRSLRLTALGIAIGLALSAVSTRLLAAFLYGVSPWDGVAFAGAALAWLGIATLASFVPARRAAQVDPAAALRWE